MSFARENLEGAAYVFEKFHGRKLDSIDISVIEDAGLAALLPDVIADMIWSALEEPQDIDYRMAAYWALGKLARKEDKERFVSALRAEVKNERRVAYQIMIALDNMNEQVFSRSGVSFDEDTLNESDAMAYLGNQK